MSRLLPSVEKVEIANPWVRSRRFHQGWANVVPAPNPALIKHMGKAADQVGGHGGMDFIMDWRLIDCLRNGLPLDQDVYDGVARSCIFPLSEQSVARRSRSLDIPDFTRGARKTNKPVDLTLEGGATTGVRKV